MSATWEQDWPIRVYERIEMLGFHSLCQFMDGRPMVSLLVLARELGPDIAAVQLESLWFREAEERGQLATFLDSLLIRRIRESLPHGWSEGDEFEFNLAAGFVSWRCVVDAVLPRSELDRIWNCVKGLQPPAGWLPVVPHDEWTSSLHQAIEEALSRS